MNWNDLKIFLAIARCGSLRGAASYSQTSVSTVSRRIDALEDKLGVRLFSRRPEGYSLTEVGQDILDDVKKLERQASHIERKVLRKDQKLEGSVRVTLPDAVVSYLLTDELKGFHHRYPDINLQIITSYDIVDIMRGDADIALRFTNTPTEQLVGKKLTGFYNCYYASKDYVQTYDLSDPACGAIWIGKDNKSQRYFESIECGPYPDFPIRWEIASFPARVAACKSGLGMAVLPCFIGDQEADLVRLDDASPFLALDTWLLMHPELRDTGRARVVMEFLVETLAGKRKLLMGDL
jgi:DNA-binding transcriptional LysR family regulator